MLQTLRCPYFLKSLAVSAPIGALAGLIGLGGGEFRLPVLMGMIGFSARAAVPLNLLVSLFVLAFAFATRSYTVPLSALAPHWAEILGLVCGGVGSAFYGARLVQGLSDKRLVKLIALLLAMLGIVLLVEAMFPLQRAGWLPQDEQLLRLGTGVAIGVGIGLVSSVLGVAGGELLIPTLLIVFGADIKIAGSASILISLVIVSVALWRYYAIGALHFGRGAQRIASAMAIGSVIGAFIGGLAIAYAPAQLLKLVLGTVLVGAAAKMLTRRQHHGG